MATGNINYSAVLADLEARKEELESAIGAVKSILAAGGGGFSGGSDGGTYSPDNIPVGSFLRLSIADATKKFLDMVKTKQTVPAIMRALEKGGLPPSKYQTVYAVLRRRESQFGDIMRFGDEWALSEWYPNNPNLRKKADKSKSKAKKKTAKKTAAKKKETATKPASSTSNAKPAGATVKAPDAAATILKEVGSGLDLKTLTERVNATSGKKLSVGLLKGMLNREPKRFKNTGNDTWDLANRAEANSAASGA